MVHDELRQHLTDQQSMGLAKAEHLSQHLYEKLQQHGFENVTHVMGPRDNFWVLCYVTVLPGMEYVITQVGVNLWDVYNAYYLRIRRGNLDVVLRHLLDLRVGNVIGDLESFNF